MAEKILIVDDDLETLRLIGMMLQRQGYEIAAAVNGTQAITMAHNEHPDLIVLDIMMPDIDGYDVTKELRKDPLIGDIPILLFTAKTQVDDKVAGYDSGADDYLTKPVHPAELVAHIKALLSRAQPQTPFIEEINHGFVIGIVGSKGGLGSSTLAVNVAASLAQLTKNEVIAAELRPGQGSWGIELGLTNTESLHKLLSLNTPEITASAIENRLVGTAFGVQLLLASNQSSDIDFIGLAEKLEAIVTNLSTLTPVLILDIGTPFLPGFDRICNLCQEILVLTDSNPSTVKRTKVIFEEIRASSTIVGRTLDLVLINHGRSDVQLSADQVSEMLSGTPVKVLIPAAPEQVYQAIQKQIPLIKFAPDGFVSQQINELARYLQGMIGK